MSYLALARKWRPKNFTELVGQEHVVRALRNALDSGRVHHAFLFTGTRGVGKTTIARIFAKSLNCETGVSSDPCGTCPVCLDVDAGRFVDLIEIDAASRTKVDDTRELLEDVVYAPSRGRYKVFLIDEVHMLSGHSFNALLKTLEEPPEHVKFLLATTDPQKLPVTVLSRCLQFNLRRLRAEEIAAQMSHILVAEGIPADAGSLALLAQAADGSLRDGLSLLDQAIAYGAGHLDEAGVRSMLGTLDQDAVLGVLEAVAEGNGPVLYAAIERMTAFVVDYGGVLTDLAAALHRIQLQQLVPEAKPAESLFDGERIAALANRIAPEDAQLYYQIATQGARDIELAPSQRIGLEMTLLRMLAFRPEDEGVHVVMAGKGESAARHASTAPAAKAIPCVDANPAQAPLPRPGTETTQASVAGRETSATVRVSEVTIAKSAPSSAPTPVTAETASRIPLPTDTSSWMAALDHMGIRAGARQLADNCVVLGEEDGTLRLGLAHEHQLLLSDILRRQIEQALSSAIDRPLRLRIELMGDQSSPAAVTADTPASRAQTARRQRQSQAEERFAGNPDIQAALVALDGEVAPGSIRPFDATP
jgi:DNA polymerase-3 subunit gamma/tau